MANKQSKQALKRRAEKRHHRAVTKKAQARRSAAHAFGAGLDEVPLFGPSLPKLSEQIWEYAEPLLHAAPDAEAQKRAAQLAIMCWNATLLPDSKVQELLGQTIRRLADGDPRLESELFEIFVMMQARKQEYFQDDNRLVVNFSLSDTPDGVHLLVASTPMRDHRPVALPTSGL